MDKKTVGYLLLTKEGDVRSWGLIYSKESADSLLERYEDMWPHLKGQLVVYEVREV